MPIDELTNEKLKNQNDKFLAMFEQNAAEHSEIKDTLKEFGTKQEEISNTLLLLPSKLVEALDKKYASKSVEKKVETLTKWFWVILGGASLIVFIIEVLANGGLNNIIKHL
jgi:hypothetical protein